MTHPWPELKWWDSGERQAAEEKIDDLEQSGFICCPKLEQLYAALESVPEREVRVAIIGQDPYPTPGVANGIAFSAPGLRQPNLPHTLKIIFREYVDDLHYDVPSSGDLSRWCQNGVFLWNSVPSCQAGLPLSNDWTEWDYLTREIFQRLSAKGIVFALLGNVAARHIAAIDTERNRVIRTSHPSPRGNRSSKSPFTGSRIFSTINAKLGELGQGPIDWRLSVGDNDAGKGDVQGTDLVRGNVLPNLTGANLGGLKRQGISPNIYTSLVF